MYEGNILNNKKQSDLGLAEAEISWLKWILQNPLELHQQSMMSELDPKNLISHHINKLAGGQDIQLESGLGLSVS